MAGSIQKINNETYRLHYMFKGNRYSETVKVSVTRKDFKKDSKLQILLADFIERVQKSNFVRDDYTFTEYAQIWLDNVVKPNYRANVVRSYINALNNRILPYLGFYKLNDINVLVLNNFFTEQQNSFTMFSDRENRPLGKATLFKLRGIIKTILQNAYEAELIPSNPCNKVRLHFNNNEIEKNSMQCYDKETYLKVLELLKYESIEHRCIIELALKTGFRRSEMFGLTWDDIDLRKKTISINRGRHRVKGQGMVVTKTKTKYSIRTISIPKSLATTLRQYKQKYKNNTFVFENLSIDGITAWFRTWQKKNNIPVIRFHDLRHTHATLLLSQGVDLKTISSRLGHSNISTTMNIYTHVLKELDKNASKKLDDIV